MAAEATCAGCGKPASPDLSFCPSCGRSLHGTSTSSVPAPRTDSPSSFAAGRYKVKRFLGEGGRKRVYLAHDVRLDRDVAIALIKSDGLDHAGMVRLRREAQAMGALGDHPHIVTIHDIGEADGQPYIVSQYMEGGSTADLLVKAEGHRLSPEDALRTTDQVCQALEHAHARGVIHRDLKPANVWLTADGTAKLGDFGLAMAMDRSRLTMEGMMVGTVSYMPPEQATGRGADARSDLYSVGAMLYEMLCGCPPFIGSDAVSIISQHINTPPVAPSWHNPQIPRVTESLILHLLAKAPEERPQSASMVRDRLRQAATAPAELAPVVPDAAPGLARLVAGPFVGRKQELVALKAAVEAALGGQGSLVMIAGEQGIGKSRLTDEAAVYARLRGAVVLVGRCYEDEGAPAFWPWVQVIRAYVHDYDPKTLMSEMGPGAADIAQVVSELRERLPGLPTPPSLEREQARFRMFDSVTTFIKNAAHARPLVLVLDDLQWADKPSLLLLQFLARELKGTRLLVVGTYHDVHLDRRHPLTEVLASLGRERPFVRIHLAGLSPAEVTALLEAVAQEPLVDYGWRLAKRLHKETDGNPFFMQEILRHLVETGLVYRRDGHWGWDEPGIADMGIVEGVREVIRRRLSRLSDECNRVLTIASVMGREFELEVLQHVSELTEDQLVEAVEEAVGAAVLTEVHGSATRYSFSHALVRQTLYDELTMIRRVRLHRRIGESMEGLFAENLDPHLAELSYHFLEAAQRADGDKVTDYARRAGERATSQLAYEDAVTHYRRALQALEEQGTPDDTARGKLLLALGDVQWRAGETKEARKTFARAVDVARTLGAPDLLAHAALGYGAGLGGFGFADKADNSLIRYLEEALTGLGQKDSALLVRVKARLAVELYYTHAFKRRASLSQEAVEMAQRLGDKSVQLVALYSRHKAMLGPDAIDERRQAADELLKLAADVGDKGMTFLGHHLRLSTLLEVGDIHAVDAEIEACEQLARELRQPVYLWQTRVFQAMRAIMDGRLEEAKTMAETALAIGQEGQGGIAMVHFGTQMFHYQVVVGLLEPLEQATRVFCEKYPSSAWSASLAFVYRELDHRDAARKIFDGLASNDFAGIRRDGNWLGAMWFLSPVCAYLGDADRAETLYRLLAPYADRNAVFGAGATCAGSMSTALGVLATAMGRLDEASGHFEAAEARERTGSKLMQVVAEIEHASMLLARQAAGDRKKAVMLLNHALATGREIGMMKWVEKALALKLQAQGVASGDLAMSMYSVAQAVQRERPDLREHAAPDGTVTIVFSDIEGYTPMIDRLGDVRGHEVLRIHNAIVRQQIAAHQGFEVKSEGDGFMIAFSSARRALNCAIAAQRAFAAHNQQHAEEPIRVRIGLHTGEAIVEAEDFFGKTINLASRIAAQARGGEILVSSLLKQLTESAGDIDFDEGREVELKGLSGAFRVHGVAWEEPTCENVIALPQGRKIVG